MSNEKGEDMIIKLWPKIVIRLGIVAFISLSLYPPWTNHGVNYKLQMAPEFGLCNYSFIWNPPHFTPLTFVVVGSPRKNQSRLPPPSSLPSVCMIDSQRLIIEWLIVVGVVALLMPLEEVESRIRRR